MMAPDFSTTIVASVAVRHVDVLAVIQLETCWSWIPARECKQLGEDEEAGRQKENILRRRDRSNDARLHET